MKRLVISVLLFLLLFQGSISRVSAAITINHDTTLSGTINISQDIFLTNSATMTVLAGTTLLMNEGVSLKGDSGCHILFQGTSSSKVIVKSAIPHTYWSQIIVKGDSSSIEIAWSDIMSGQIYAMDSSTLIITDSYLHDYLKLPTKNLVYTHNATYFHMNRCHVSNYYQINPLNTPILIENSLFEYINEDGIDCDNSPSALIRNCTFRNGLCEKGKVHSVDAIDFGKYNMEGLGSVGTVQNCFMYNITDKGVSAGEGCRSINITGCVFYKCGSGGTIKDSSVAMINNNTIVSCEYGIECVEKNEGMGAGHATGMNNILWNNNTTVYLDNDGTLSLTYSDISFNGIFPGVGNINSYPMFEDTLALNFQLSPGSPCIGTGSGSLDMGSLFPVGGISAPSNFLNIGIPYSGEVITGDSLYVISWLNGDSIHFVNLEFSSDDGNTWNVIAQNINAQIGSYTWTVPNTYSSKCFIKVIDAINQVNSSTQNLAFSIIPVGDKSPIPIFSLPAGYYSGTIDVGITADTSSVIFYTLDGSEPTDQSPRYTQPITLRQQFISSTNPVQNITATNKPNYPLSYIRTAPVNQIGPTYFGWNTPQGTTDMVAVIKARSYSPGHALGDVFTNTYLIDSTGTLNPSRLPVISMTTNKENLFDCWSGIYIPGAAFTGYSWTGNYELSGSESEREINFEYFDSAGTRVISLPSGIRIRGEWIRGFGQKALSLFARSEYDTVNYFNYKFFPGYKRNEIGGDMATFKRLILRNSGNEWLGPLNTMLKDGAVQSLLDHLHFKYQAQKQAIMFLDGEYWGIHNIRELPDEYSIATTYSIDKDNIAIVEHSPWELYNLKAGTENDKNEYITLINYLMSINLNGPGVWEYINTKIDIQNFTDYWVSTLYSVRATVDHNIGWWKCSEHGYDANAPYGKDGKWRWFAYDFDDAFKDPSTNMIQRFGWNGYKDFLFYPLVTCNKFRDVLITRYCDLLNSSFKPARVEKRMLEFKSEIQTEIVRHRNRWGTPTNIAYWDDGIDSLINFGYTRIPFAYNEMKTFFGLQSTASLSVNVSDVTKGKIQVNTIKIDADLPGIDSVIYPWLGDYFKNFPLTLVAIPEPGFRFVMWIETGITNDTVSVILNGDSTFTALFDIDPDYQPTVYPVLYINELCASNNSLIDNYGGTPDWFEIYNPNDTVVDLAGWYVSDEWDYLTKHRFAVNDSTKIPAHGFKLMYADGETAQGCLHTSFNLDAGGDQIYLTTPDAHSIIDSANFGFQVTDTSYGRYPDGSPLWEFFSYTTPGASNVHIDVTEIPGSPELKVFPNPLSTGVLHFSRPVTFRLFNNIGQEIMSSKQVSEADISNLQKGVYLILTEEGITVRLIKIN